MRFLVDRCAGRRLADWLRAEGHDVAEVSQRGPDPGDRAVLEWAVAEARILVTIDTDFGALIFHQEAAHGGVLRLPDLPASERIALMAEVLAQHGTKLENGAIVTIRSGRIRVSHPR